MSVDEKIQAAEEKTRRAKAYHDRLLVIQRAEAEIPSLWDTKQVTQSGLAETYGISPMTVKRILQDAGREIHRFRKLNDEERAEVIAHLKNGATPDEIAAGYQVSRTTIRRVGVEGGVISKGSRKPRRSDEEYLLILAFDQECRARFNGAGLYNLGMGLRTWQAKKRGEMEAIRAAGDADITAPSEPQPVDGVGNEIPPPIYVEPELTPEPAPEVEAEPVYDFAAENEAKVAAQPTPPTSPFDEAHSIQDSPVATQPTTPGDQPVPVVFGDGDQDAAAVVGPFAKQAEPKSGFNF